MDIVKPIYEPLTRRAGRRALLGRMRVRESPEGGRFTRGDVTKLLDGAWGVTRRPLAAFLLNRPRGAR